MTARPPQPDPDLVVSAAIEALTDARWESSDLLARRSAQLAPDLLRGHAAELAASAVGRDQVLSVALDAAARDLEEGRAPLGDDALFFFHQTAPERSARETVRTAVLRQGGVPVAESRRVAEDLERRHRGQCSDIGELSRQLVADARLHELLWDDPRLLADDRTRLVILCSVPRLLERAEALARNTARRVASGDATGQAFRALDQALANTNRGCATGRGRTPAAASSDVAPRGHVWSAAAGWLLLAGLFAMVLMGLLGVG